MKLNDIKKLNENNNRFTGVIEYFGYFDHGDLIKMGEATINDIEQVKQLISKHQGVDLSDLSIEEYSDGIYVILDDTIYAILSSRDIIDSHNK